MLKLKIKETLKCIAIFAMTSLLLSDAVAREAQLNSAIISTCGERQMVLGSLKKDYKEVQDAIGISNGGGLIEVFVSPEGSFSITVTSPNKITCIISAGENWNKNKNSAVPGQMI